MKRSSSKRRLAAWRGRYFEDSIRSSSVRGVSEDSGTAAAGGPDFTRFLATPCLRAGLGRALGRAAGWGSLALARAEVAPGDAFRPRVAPALFVPAAAGLVSSAFLAF